MELKEDSYEYSTNFRVIRNVGSVKQTAQNWANALAVRLPALRSVAFETRPHTGRGLGPRVLVGPPSWVWFSSIGSGVGEHHMNLGEPQSESQLEEDQDHENRWGLPQGPQDYQPI